MKFLPLFPTGLPPATIDKSGPLRRNPHCGRCSLSERAIKRCLPPVGEKGGLLLVAGSPDKQSNATGISFSSGGGRYAVGVAKKFWSGPLAGTYAAACHAGELAVEEKHLAKCRPYLRSFIDEIAPTRIVLLGGAAIRGVLGRYVHARSARCGFSWVTVDGRKVPVILLMNPDHPDQGGELDGRFAKAAFESDMQWACTVSDDFLRERREFIESSVYSVVSDEATALEAEEILRNEAKRLGRPVTWDVETRGKMFDSDFRIISAALGIAGTNISFVWDREALAKGSAASDALVRLLKDPDLCWVEQGSYDELAAMCYFGAPIAGERRDVRLVRKALDCAVKAADLDTLSELVGTGGYKADFEAHLKNAREKVKKWNPAQGMLFDECPDPTARQRLWDLSRLEDKKIFDEYEKSYLYALVPSDVLPLYNARDQITTGLLHEELWPKLQADPGLVLLWNEVTGPASRSYTWAEYWGAPMSRGAIRAVIQESKSAKAALEPQLRAHLTPQFAKVSFSSDEQVAGFLFTPTELGGLGLPVVKKTDTGAPSVDAEALETLYAQFNHPFIELFSAYVSQDTDRKKVEEFERFLREDGRMHPTYLLDGTETGRPSCVAKGTFIEVLRDVGAQPRGVPIEDVKVGDLVYSYDDRGELRIRPVIAVWPNGRKRVIRVHWLGSGRQHSGYVDLTPEHLVKRTDGKWVPASELRVGENVFALSRGISSMGYARLWATGDKEFPREHRLAFREIFGSEPEVVHHVNGNKLDNRASNLRATNRRDHGSHHGLEFDRGSDYFSKIAKKGWEKSRDQILAKMRENAEKRSLNLTKEQILEILEAHDWSMTRVARAGSCDFETFKKYIRRVGLNPNEIIEKAKVVAKLKGHGKGVYKRRARVYNCKNCGRSGHYTTTCPEPKVNNHTIVSIQWLEEEVEVFDLTVDGTHNFIANEICVHNCHAPNLFNMKSPEECDSCSGKGCENCDFTGATAESRRIRACFEAPEDFEILETDLSQVELRGMAVLADEPVLIEAYLHGKDIHNGTIEFVFEVSGRKISRRYAKIGNFLIPYGGRARTFAASLKIPIEMARVIFDAIEGRYPNVKSAKARFLEEARRTGTTCNYWFVDGLPVPCQKRPLWNLDSSDNYLRNKAENGVFNTRIQGTFSGSLVLASHARIVKYILDNGLQHLWRPAVNVYDSIIGPCHKALLPLAARMTVDVMTSWVVKWMPDGKPFPLEADCKVGRNLGVAKKYKPPKTYAEAVAECRRLGLDEVLRKRPVLNG